jgi:hypothetical protein
MQFLRAGDLLDFVKTPRIHTALITHLLDHPNSYSGVYDLLANPRRSERGASKSGGAADVAEDTPISPPIRREPRLVYIPDRCTHTYRAVIQTIGRQTLGRYLACYETSTKNTIDFRRTATRNSLGASICRASPARRE